MFEQALSGLSTINQLELLIPTSILAVMLVAISKSGFGGGLGGLGFPLMVLVLPPKLALAVFLPLTLLTDIWVIFVWRKFFIFEIIWMMVLGGMIGQLLCWVFFNYLDDKSILIFAINEMFYGTLDKPIIIDESIRLAKKFSSPDSYKFLNATLDKILKKGI